ncbi:LOW QUALITY PROTEIN: hypothetical protein ACHAWF_015099 [Thalassiosira exigua]
MPNIPIATVASTHRSQHGTKSILVLYFGRKLDHSLINPNQIRHYGIALSDNPFDMDKSLGIDHDQDFIPFELEGATVYFETTYPTMDEIETHPHIVLTDGEVPWDPMDFDMNADRPYGGPMYDDMRGIRTAMRPIHRRCRVDHLNLHINDLAGKWQMNWMPSKVKSLSQNVGAFVISNGSFTEVYPQSDHKSSIAVDFLRRFCDNVGVPISLKTDRAKEFVDRMTDFRKLVKK